MGALERFFKGREAVRVKRIRGMRAIYEGPDHVEANIEFVSEEGERLTLRLGVGQLHQLILDMHNVYDAIRPPLSGGGRYADYQGMDDTSS